MLRKLARGASQLLTEGLRGSFESQRGFANLAMSSDYACVTAGFPSGPLRNLLFLGAPSKAFGPGAPIGGELSNDAAQAIPGHFRPDTVCVLREAFKPFDGKSRAVGDILRGIHVGAVAVSNSALPSHSRVLVDVFDLDETSGVYRLSEAAVDIFRFLKGEGVRVKLTQGPASVMHPPYVEEGWRATTRQSTNEVFMVAPTAFTFNEQAALDNHFMNRVVKEGGDIGSAVREQVLKEFAGLYRVLTEDAGVRVHLWAHSADHDTPDACFPNNWFSTHPAGEAAGNVKSDTLVLYPMKVPNRNKERRPEMVSYIESLDRYSKVVDMTKEHSYQGRQCYLEGTGALVIDRVAGTAYMCVSERADRPMLEDWAKRVGYNKLVTFTSTDGAGRPVYHTNVMMAIGSTSAIVCAESVPDPGERKNLIFSLVQSGHEVIEITREQMGHLCGNALELEDRNGLPVWVMSTQAYNALTPDQRERLARHVAAIHHAPIDTLERIGGGGVRCTLAELF